MINQAIYSNQSTVYPGLYTPVAEAEALLNAIKRNNSAESAGTTARIDKRADHLLIEIALPGFNRQDIFITGYGNSLSVVVLPGNNVVVAEGAVGQEKYHNPVFVQKLLMPGDADGLFGSAIYKDGYLTIYIPTGRLSTDVLSNYRIMVY